MHSSDAGSAAKGLLLILGATAITWYIIGPAAALATMVWLLFALVLHLSLVSGR